MCSFLYVCFAIYLIILSHFSLMTFNFSKFVYSLRYIIQFKIYVQPLLKTTVYILVYFIKQENVCMLSHFSHVQLFVTLWTVACQAPLSMGILQQEYWSRLLFPSPGDLPDPGVEPTSPTSPALAGMFFTTNATWEDKG